MTFPTVGVVGGGQLARMMQPAAVALGVRLVVLADVADDSAAQVVPDVVVGDYRDRSTLESFASGCDVVTFDHEHVPAEHLRALVAAGFTVRPGPAALAHAQDKSVMRERLGAMGAPVPRWRTVKDVADVVAFAEGSSWPLVLKATRGGYDGKGVWVVADADEADWVLSHDQVPGFLVEERVPFTRELAALVARSPSGQAVAYPVVETVQVDGICREVYAPAPGLDPDHAVAAQEVALRIAGELDVVGVLAVELFDTPAGVLVNELAMRPHNSGHWTIDGSVTSQFENHLRAVLDLPLGDPSVTRPGDGDGERPRWRPPGPLPRLPALHGPRPRTQGAHVRQGGSPRSQGGARHGDRRTRRRVQGAGQTCGVLPERRHR